MCEKELNELVEMIEKSSRGGINGEVRKRCLEYGDIKRDSINGFSCNGFEGSDNINVWDWCWK